VLAASLLAPGLAAGERAPTAVLWLGTADERVTAAVERALASSAELRPLSDEAARRTLIDGGPVARVAARLAEGRERYAALTELAEADRRLAEAEATALRELPVAEACPRLAEIETLRLRYAELTLDEGAAARAALLLSACASAYATALAPEVATAVARHPVPPPHALPAARIESEPPGAGVYLDLRLIGKTPLALPVERRADAWLDVEAPGMRKVHRAAPEAGMLAVSLSPEERLGPLIDRARAAAGGEPPADLVASIGREVGAVRVIVLRRSPDGAALQARVVDVAAGAWTNPPLSLPLDAFARPPMDGPESAGARIAGYAAPSQSAPAAVAPPTVAAAAAPPVAVAAAPTIVAAPSVAPSKNATPKPVPPWKRWYTWVAAGGVLALVGGLWLADHYGVGQGSDQITVHVTH
jgi:hypothetical protein